MMLYKYTISIISIVMVWGCTSVVPTDESESMSRSINICEIDKLSMDYNKVPYNYINNFERCYEDGEEISSFVNGYLYSLVMVGEYEKISQVLYSNKFQDMNYWRGLIEGTNFL